MSAMQTIRIAEHFDRTEQIKCPDRRHSNDEDTTRTPCDKPRTSIGVCSVVSGLPAHGYRKNDRVYDKR